MTEELKACPFCGGTAKVHELQLRTSSIGGYFVMCSKCQTSGNNYSTEENAIERWNRRIGNDEGKAN